ncbi:glycosyltransferase [Idiomarina seosinensis]|uniref:glycosyltransferase family 2 protein n=1 Tax=Idiomarina seosinensis TaxID=281739 RepID=UPI00385101FC
MTNSKELVSVIMPSFNSATCIERTIRSVQAQTHANWELLITDDCSTDNTVEIVESLAKSDARIKLSRLPNNSGAAVARNEAIKRAKGRYIAFLDADDRWLESKLEAQITFMQQHSVALCYSAYHTIKDGSRVNTFIPPASIGYKDLLKTCSIGCLTAIYDVQYVGKRYMPLIRKRQDFALWLDILRDGTVAKGLKKPLAEYTLGGGISQNKLKVLQYQWSVYRDVEKLSLLTSCYYFFCYGINGLIKYR